MKPFFCLGLTIMMITFISGCLMLGKNKEDQPFDRLAPRKRRPSGRGQGELYRNVYLPYREAPPFRVGRLHTSGLDQLSPGQTTASGVTAIFSAPTQVVKLFNGNAHIYKRSLSKGTGDLVSTRESWELR